MENDELIKRVKSTPKSKLLRLEPTRKGLDMIKIGKQNKSIDKIFSFLSEEERQQITSTLNKILINAKEYNLVSKKRQSIDKSDSVASYLLRTKALKISKSTVLRRVM